jgi:N6-adenosine-specific RNA methylase IME4
MIRLPDGKFACIAADPPWHHASRSPKGQTRRSPSHHYPTMRLAEIAAMPVAQIAARDCHLWLWTTGPHLQQAFRVMEAWGFRYSSLGFVWITRHTRAGDVAAPGARPLFMDARDLNWGPGYTTRQNAELCLLGRRGAPKRLAKDVFQVIVAPRREHSRKPDEFFPRVERYCGGPRLELFARERREGWTAWGNDVDHFQSEEAA